MRKKKASSESEKLEKYCTLVYKINWLLTDVRMSWEEGAISLQFLIVGATSKCNASSGECSA